MAGPGAGPKWSTRASRGSEDQCPGSPCQNAVLEPRRGGAMRTGVIPRRAAPEGRGAAAAPQPSHRRRAGQGAGERAPIVAARPPKGGQGGGQATQAERPHPPGGD